MRTLLLVGLTSSLVACGPLSPTESGGGTTETDTAIVAPETLSQVAEEPAVPRSPAVFATLLAEHDRLVASGADAAEIAHVRARLDHVAAQYDAHASRLYWYTDLEEAKAEARRTGRPILSLHLLGRLDAELSCANSRLFRMMLYANPHVAAVLRESYVLHWQSERPVPEITIDFGDGRKVKRTITGNSIHYVLDSEGRVVDGIPGLYGPVAFESALKESLELAKKSSALTDADSQKLVAKHHEQMVWRKTAQWRKLLRKAYGDGYEDRLGNATLPTSVGYTRWPDPLWNSLPAAVVNQLTISKADTEGPPVALMQPQIYVGSPWEGWDKITVFLPADKLAPESRAIFAAQRPRDFNTKEADALAPALLDKHLAYFEKRLAEESARNEYAFHGAIHERLRVPANVVLGPLDEWVYAKVFLTPAKDAWLGLMPTEAVTGITDDGLSSEAPAHRAMR